jgi:hypothetical protein
VYLSPLRSIAHQPYSRIGLVIASPSFSTASHCHRHISRRPPALSCEYEYFVHLSVPQLSKFRLRFACVFPEAGSGGDRTVVEYFRFNAKRGLVLLLGVIPSLHLLLRPLPLSLLQSTRGPTNKSRERSGPGIRKKQVAGLELMRPEIRLDRHFFQLAVYHYTFPVFS